jgi:glycosyltransferase involved in cell wall biosynthesis
MMKKENLLIFTNLYPLPWERNRATFNKQQFDLLKEKYNLHIAVPIAWPEYVKKSKTYDMNAEGITYFPYFYTPKKGRRFYPKLMKWSLKLLGSKILKNFNPDKILASWAFPEGVVGAELAEELNIPFYLKVHGSDINGHGEIPSRAHQIVKSANKANGILSVSQALSDKMVSMGINQDKIDVIYNGVNKEKFYRDEAVARENNILYVGNLKDTKGVMELIEAFYMISQEHPDYKLTFAGGGHMLHSLKEYASEKNIADRVKFLGPVNHEQIPDLMKTSKFIALPSYAEGVPNVLLESMSCGTPVISTDVGGIPEIVPIEKLGILCKSKDSKAFAEALSRGLSCNWESLYIANYAKRFDWSVNQEKLLNLLAK